MENTEKRVIDFKALRRADIRFIANRLYRVASRTTRCAKSLRGIKNASDVLNWDARQDGIGLVTKDLKHVREWLVYCESLLDYIIKDDWVAEVPEEPKDYLY